MKSLIDDISAVTCIPKRTLEHLCETSNLCIGDCLLESLLDKKSLCAIDIGIGTLNIKLENDLIKYKFIPSKHLEEINRFTIINKQSPLLNSVDISIKNRIDNTYKELI